MKIDLHVHSIYSFDSTETVDDIIDLAIKNDVKVISITDHNEYLGSIEALKSDKIEVISGIEIDCFFDDNVIHLLGYGLSFDDKRIKKLKEHYVNELKRIAYARLHKIEEKYSCKLDIDKIKSYSNFDGFSNVEIERVLLEDVKHPELEIYQTGSKSKNPISNYYWDNLVIGKWGYVEMKLPDYKDIIKLIHENHGVVVLAHPIVNLNHDKERIKKLIDEGIDGIEVYTTYHNKEDAKFFGDIADKYGLIKTLGSDFHGITKPNIEIGKTGHDIDGSFIIKELRERISRY